MDTDLDRMSREQLIEELKRLRNGIRAHRDATRHELCWHQPALWGYCRWPNWPQFIEGCVKYRQSLEQQAARAPRTDEPYQE